MVKTKITFNTILTKTHDSIKKIKRNLLLWVKKINKLQKYIR